jgi:hypothetical protein
MTTTNRTEMTSSLGFTGTPQHLQLLVTLYAKARLDVDAESRDPSGPNFLMQVDSRLVAQMCLALIASYKVAEGLPEMHRELNKLTELACSGKVACP